MFKKIVFLFLVILFFSINPIAAFADDCDPSSCSSGDSDCLKKVQDACTKKLSELSTTKNTLSNQIKILNSQYDLTLLRITQTENSIKTLDREINDLTVKIIDLDKRLDELAALYVVEVIENYKLQKKVPPYAFLLTSKLNTFLEQYKYVANVQKASQNSMLNMQTVKTDFDTQKAQKAQKQQEMETLQKTLDSQKITLNNQKIAKDKLLESTKNDEKEYQKRLSAVQSKLSSFATAGAECLSSSPGGGGDGNYFSQIDPRWCAAKPAGTEGCIISGTNKACTIGRIGCYITSTAMILKKLGIDTNPLIYASDINHMESSADMKAIDVPIGYKYCKYSNSNQQNIYKVIDSELNSGRYVIAQVPMSPYHFIVLTSGSNGNYKMHDPWKGADLAFSYNKIISARLITTNSFCPQ